MTQRQGMCGRTPPCGLVGKSLDSAIIVLSWVAVIIQPMGQKGSFHYFFTRTGPAATGLFYPRHPWQITSPSGSHLAGVTVRTRMLSACLVVCRAQLPCSFGFAIIGTEAIERCGRRGRAEGLGEGVGLDAQASPRVSPRPSHAHPRKQVKSRACRRLAAYKKAQQPAEAGCGLRGAG